MQQRRRHKRSQRRQRKGTSCRVATLGYCTVPSGLIFCLAPDFCIVLLGLTTSISLSSPTPKSKVFWAIIFSPFDRVPTPGFHLGLSFGGSVATFSLNRLPASFQTLESCRRSSSNRLGSSAEENASLASRGKRLGRWSMLIILNGLVLDPSPRSTFRVGFANVVQSS